MWIVEIFDGANWNQVSTHSQEADAQFQKTIYENSNGIDPANIRTSEVTPPQ